MIQYAIPALTECAGRQTFRKVNKLNGGDCVDALNQGTSRSMLEGYRSETERVWGKICIERRATGGQRDGGRVVVGEGDDDGLETVGG